MHLTSMSGQHAPKHSQVDRVVVYPQLSSFVQGQFLPHSSLDIARSDRIIGQTFV